MANNDKPTSTVRVSCLCKANQHDLTLPRNYFPLPVDLCHSKSCRHLTGTLCQTVAVWDDQHPPARAVLDGLQTYTFSNRSTVWFCSTCGTKLLWRIPSRSSCNNEDSSANLLWGVSTGALEAGDAVFEIQSHSYIRDTLDGGLADMLPSILDKTLARWPDHRGRGEQVPFPYQTHSPPESTTSELRPDRLRAHCHCGALEFWISPPYKGSEEARAQWPDALIAYSSGEPLPPETQPWWLRAGGTKYLAAFCCCDTCRLASGMEWVQWAFVPAVNLLRDADGQHLLNLDEVACLRKYRSSAGVSRYFCGTCGAFAIWYGDDRPDVVDVAIGLLDSSRGARAEDWLSWAWKRMSFDEHGMARSPVVTKSMVDGLMEYGQRLQRQAQ